MYLLACLYSVSLFAEVLIVPKHAKLDQSKRLNLMKSGSPRSDQLLIMTKDLVWLNSLCRVSKMRSFVHYDQDPCLAKLSVPTTPR